jgi:starch synthase (maltosyl-transferring)
MARGRISSVIIDDVRPRTPTGRPAKAVIGERVPVSADVFRDGHDLVIARVGWREKGAKSWQHAPLDDAGNDRWSGYVELDQIGLHELRIEAWTDRVATWRHGIEAKVDAGQDVGVEIEEGARLFETIAAHAPKADRPTLVDAAAELRRTGDLHAAEPALELARAVPDPVDVTISAPVLLWVDRGRARFNAWYELFPRSEGGLAGAAKRLPAIAAMGFDIVYLPPIHPIGTTARKGMNNTLEAGPDDPGSPWAIGAAEGGHTEVHPELGTIDDFDRFVVDARDNGLEVALDYALQCSPDHPWVREHPEWFHHRPDGSIKYAENPPKKYQDIYPINFLPASDADRAALWDACKRILDHWIAHDVRIFRVDNPHTKPFAFWEWLIGAIQAEHPDVLFLAEAFTRPKVMAKLAEIGFTLSYTYFTWRTERWELEEYLGQLGHGPTADYMRPSFWPNTPDILSGPLRHGPRSAFELRLVLAALLSPSYGIYSGYELCENEPASPDNEEYLHSEKYEIKSRDWDREDSLTPLITKLNSIRARHPAFEELRTIRFHGATDDHLLVWSKSDAKGGDVVLCVVNLDPRGMHEGTLALDMPALGLGWDASYEVTDELTERAYTWFGSTPYVRLEAGGAHVFSVETP